MNFLKSVFGGGSNSAISAAEVKARLDTGDPILVLDVRDADEFRGGHIEGARLIPLGELGRRLNELPTDMDIICICASGSRSAHATRQLLGAGRKAFNMRGGMFAWQMAGYPAKKGR